MMERCNHPFARAILIMSWTLSGMLLACFGLSLILVTLSSRLMRGTPLASETYSPTARFFLIALRVFIGWHCFIEGMEKLSTPTWTSETYLRESMGPLSPAFRSVAGDRLIDKLTLGDNESFPAELEREWREYFDAFVAYHNLSDEQLQRAQGIFDQRKSDTLTYLKSATEEVIKIAAYEPKLPLEMTMAQRLEEHERLLERVRAAEAKFPTDDMSAHADWKSAKADLAKWRAELKRSVDAQTHKLKRVDEATKLRVKKRLEELKPLLKDAEAAKDAKEIERLKKDITAENAKLWSALGDVLTSDQLAKPPLPESKAPMASWRQLEWSDFLVKWGLVVLGGCLMLGLFSRCASVTTALLVLSFYLAMPPLPGWPESPRLEGHYLLINKTLIEIIALFALTFIPTGRWAGVDGLLGALFCRK